MVKDSEVRICLMCFRDQQQGQCGPSEEEYNSKRLNQSKSRDL